MKKVINQTIELTEKEIIEVLKEKFQIKGNIDVNWILKHKPHGKYDDI